MVSLAAAAVLLTGCGVPSDPQVTFYSAGHAVTASPYRYCDVHVTHCERDNGALVHLDVRPGSSVEISVPGDVARSPWTVVIQYRDASGREHPPANVATFTPGERYAYTVHPPSPADQLTTVEVQQVGAAFALTPEGKLITDRGGDPVLQIRAVWALQIQP